MINPNKYYLSLEKEEVNCPTCGNDKYNVLSQKDRYGMGVQTVICNKCSLMYVNPRPTEGEMAEFYKLHYRKVYESIETPNEEYINSGPFIPRGKFVVEKLSHFLDVSESFLDIGCAEGTLLSLVEKDYSNLKTLGIEPSKSFGNYAKNNVKGDVFVGTYQEYLRENEIKKYDVITTTHVLEHILNPINYLKGISAFMHNNSILYIEVPNIMNEKAKGIGNIHLGHVLYFDPITLQLLLDKCGFEIIEVFTENLPALTPSMAIICKIKSKKTKIGLPTSNFISDKSKKIKKRVFGIIGTKIQNKGLLATLYKKLKINN